MITEFINKHLDRMTAKKLLLGNMIVVLTYGFVSNVVYAAGNTKQLQMLNEIKTVQQNQNHDINQLKTDILIAEENAVTLEEITNELADVRVSQHNMKVFEFQTELASLEKLEDKEKWFAEYMDVIDRYQGIVETPQTIYDVYTEDEIFLLERMVQTEIGSGDFESKVHVADVVWNRIESEDWPNTITGVVTSPSQFAFGATCITESTRLAVEYSFMFPDETYGALAFHSMGQAGQDDRFGNYVFIFNDNYHNYFGEGRNGLEQIEETGGI